MKRPSDYAVTQGANPETGFGLGYALRPYLAGPLDDLAPRLVLMKGAQVGATVLAILRAVWFVDRLNAHALYLMPTHRSAVRLSRGRVATLLERSPRLARLFGKQRNAAHLRAGTANFYCHGARSRAELMSTPIQYLTIDERDEMYQTDPHGKQPWSALELARQRLAGQRHSWELNLSTPTLPGWGIAAEYAQTDQHAFELKCPKCGREAPASWPESLAWCEAEADRLPPAFCCSACRQVWSEEERLQALQDGGWRAQRPGAGVRGYHLPQLLSPALTAAKLADAWRAAQASPAAMQIFRNSVLGLPHLASGSRLEREHLEEAQRRGGYLMAHGADRPCVLGADIGPQWLHVVVLEPCPGGCRAVRIEKVPSWNDLAGLVKRFKVGSFVLDAQPETHQARQFADAHPGGWLCYYQGGEGVAVEPATKTLRAHRTQTLDDLCQRLRQGEILLPRDTPSEFIQQLESPVRLLRSGKGGQMRAEYVEAGGPDHYAHALNYALLALRLAARPVAWSVTAPSGGKLAWE